MAPGTARHTPLADSPYLGDQLLRSLGLGIRIRDLLRNLIRSGRLAFCTEGPRVYASISDGPGSRRSGRRQPAHSWYWCGCLGGASRWRHCSSTRTGNACTAAVVAQEKARVWKVEGQLGQKAQSQEKDRAQLEAQFIVEKFGTLANSPDTNGRRPNRTDHPNRCSAMTASTSSLGISSSR